MTSQHRKRRCAFMLSVISLSAVRGHRTRAWSWSPSSHGWTVLCGEARLGQHSLPTRWHQSGGPGHTCAHGCVTHRSQRENPEGLSVNNGYKKVWALQLVDYYSAFKKSKVWHWLPQGQTIRHFVKWNKESSSYEKTHRALFQSYEAPRAGKFPEAKSRWWLPRAGGGE